MDFEMVIALHRTYILLRNLQLLGARFLRFLAHTPLARDPFRFSRSRVSTGHAGSVELELIHSAPPPLRCPGV